jgi:hypothetical protein
LGLFHSKLHLCRWDKIIMNNLYEIFDDHNVDWPKWKRTIKHVKAANRIMNNIYLRYNSVLWWCQLRSQRNSIFGSSSLLFALQRRVYVLFLLFVYICLNFSPKGFPYRMMFMLLNITVATRGRQNRYKENENKLKVPLRTQPLRLMLHL